VRTLSTEYNSALVIDDDNDLCLLLKSLLETVITSVDCADNLQSGFRAIDTLRPDVIFVDNNLPDGQSSGYISRMKEISPASVIILISAIDNFTENAKEFGADGFIAKPLTMESITRALNPI
jgi:two-component SAPR family response regulator